MTASTDPAPRFEGPIAAMEALIEWGIAYRKLMAKRDFLIRGALAEHLTRGATRDQRATRITPTRIVRAAGVTRPVITRGNNRQEIPRLDQDRCTEVDWDGYADHLDTRAAAIQSAPEKCSPPHEGSRSLTAGGVKARLLRNLAERLRGTDLTDAAFWELTIELRQEIAECARAAPGFREDWREPESERSLRRNRAELCREVADQITQYRINGPTPDP